MLDVINNLLIQKKDSVSEWMENQARGLIFPITLSCDIRHAGFKMGVVDTNLFPAGFNNLCNSFSRATTEAFKKTLHEHHPQVHKILVYGEEHTRNKFYLKNIRSLQKLLHLAGFQARIGVLGDFIPAKRLEIDLEGETVILEKIERDRNLLKLENFAPDMILSNNDFSLGLPPLFQGIEQPIIPSPKLGWQIRTKSGHFDILSKLLGEFCKTFEIDPWLLQPLCDLVPSIDFNDKKSLESLAQHMESLLDRIRQKYREYKIEETPYVFLKNNAGTYGMGLASFFSGDEVLNLNSRQKNKLLSSKGKAPINSYLIQEGIPTVDTYSGYPIEPVIYAVGGKDIGGFFRIHESKNAFESLNAPGMTFSCLCLHKLTEPHEDFFLDCQQKESVVNLSRFLTRMASLAAAREVVG